MKRVNFNYLIWVIVLFITEVLIAVFAHDSFIRPTFGDFLVVLLMYCGIKAFIRSSYRVVAIAVLLIAYAIEVSQYFHLVKHLGLQKVTIANLILGNGFSWGDMLAYTLGVLMIWLIENARQNRLPTSTTSVV